MKISELQFRLRVIEEEYGNLEIIRVIKSNELKKGSEFKTKLMNRDIFTVYDTDGIRTVEVE